MNLTPKQILGFDLNDEQQTAVDSIIKWGKEEFNNDPFHILGGYAGSGKSTVIKVIVANLYGTVLCAPTNKAVKVLSNLNTGKECMTIYSLLGLKMEQHEDELVLTKAEKDKVGKYRIIIIDECGMVNTELLKYIEKAAKTYGCKVLFVGDPAQLNPVGENRSPIWGKYDIDVLKKVERHDNQILKMATHIRETKIPDLNMRNDNDEKEGVWYLDHSDFISKIKEFAKNGSFATQSRAIAWRNKTVDKLNSIIREEIYGVEKTEKHVWLKDERIVFTSPYNTETTNVITDEEAVVKMFAVQQHLKYPEFKAYYLTLEFGDKYPYTETIPVLHEDSFHAHKKKLAELAHLARKADYKTKGALWKEFWEIKEMFAQIKYGYALTAHRAQGSTFENAFVDVNDILSNSNSVEAKRCLYVAVTRPTTRLFLE